MLLTRGRVFAAAAVLSTLAFWAALVGWLLANLYDKTIVYDARRAWVAEDDPAGPSWHYSRLLLTSSKSGLGVHLGDTTSRNPRQLQAARRSYGVRGKTDRHFGEPRMDTLPVPQQVPYGVTFAQWTSSNPAIAMTQTSKGAGIAYWAVLSLTALLPASWLLRRWIKSRRPTGLCRTCGYDLRHSPERCPECGQQVPPASAVT